MNLSKRVNQLTPSSTLAISQKANELKAAGYDVIGLGVGEPDFNTPAYINDAAKKAIDEGKTKYTASGGIIELKEAIINKFKNDHSLIYQPNEVIVTTGAKYALYALFQATINEGDEVIIPTPYWVSYPEHVKLAGGKPVYLEGKELNDFKVTAEQIESIVTDKTKAIILNSPSNPTGMMYSLEELKTIAKVCIKHNLLIISDEIYESLVYTNDKHISIAEVSNEAKERTVIINGVSKSHAMTGWRIGYAAGPKEIIKGMTNHASHATSNPSSISQYAALAAYTEENSVGEEMREIFSERLNVFYDLLNEIEGISCLKPKGAFYLFPNVKEAVKNSKYKTTEEWVRGLLEEEKVAVVPGSSFGAVDNIRLSYATSLETLKEAAKRIKRFTEKQ